MSSSVVVVIVMPADSFVAWRGVATMVTTEDFLVGTIFIESAFVWYRISLAEHTLPLSEDRFLRVFTIFSLR
jgi:hypothetical protein